MVFCIVSMGFMGCQGTGYTVNFDPHALGSASPTQNSSQQNLKILVQPFQDSRQEQQRIGSRTHLWGGATHFNAWDGNVGEGMADLAVEYLNQQQWEAYREPQDINAVSGSPDVILRGEVLSLETVAKSGFGFTRLDVGIRVRFEAKNTIDSSRVNMVLGANGTETVTFFNEKDVEQLTNLVGQDLFHQLFRDLTVKNKALHLKSDAP